MKYAYLNAFNIETQYYKQLELLKTYNPDKIIVESSDNNSGSTSFDNLLHLLEPGDTVIFYKLSILNLSITKLINLLMTFNKENIRLIVIDIQLDTANNKNFFNVIEMLKDAEREVIVRRNKLTKNTRKKKQGRPKVSNDVKERLVEMYHNNATYSEMQEELGISRVSISKYLKEYKKND